MGEPWGDTLPSNVRQNSTGQSHRDMQPQGCRGGLRGFGLPAIRTVGRPLEAGPEFPGLQFCLCDYVT